MLLLCAPDIVSLSQCHTTHRERANVSVPNRRLEVHTGLHTGWGGGHDLTAASSEGSSVAAHSGPEEQAQQQRQGEEVGDEEWVPWRKPQDSVAQLSLGI